MLVVQRALLRIIIHRGKVFRFPTDSERYVQQFVTTFRMVFVTQPKIYCGEKLVKKTGNSKIGLITHTLRAQIIISQQAVRNNFAIEKYLIVHTFKMDQKIYMQFCAGVSL